MDRGVREGRALTVYTIVDSSTGERISTVRLADKDVQEFVDLVEEQGYHLEEGEEA